MNRLALIALAAVIAASAVAITRCAPTTPVTPAVEAQAPTKTAAESTPAAPPMPVGESCSSVCDGQNVQITCAQGETPICDCNTQPRPHCQSPAVSAP